MRFILGLMLLVCIWTQTYGQDSVSFSKWIVVYYHENLYDNQNGPYVQNRAMILSDARLVSVGPRVFLAGTIPPGMGLPASEGSVLLDFSWVYLTVGTDNARAARGLLDAASKGVWFELPSPAVPQGPVKE